MKSEAIIIMQLNLHDLGHIRGLENEFSRWKSSSRRPPRRSEENGTYIAQNNIMCDDVYLASHCLFG